MTDEEALDRVKYLSKELVRTDLTHEEVLERLTFKDKEISDEIMNLIHNHPIMYDCDINDYRIETESEIKARRSSHSAFASWLDKATLNPFVR